MCDSVWCSAFTPTQVWRTWLNDRDHCRVRHARAIAGQRRHRQRVLDAQQLGVALVGLEVDARARRRAPHVAMPAPAGFIGLFRRFSIDDSPSTCCSQLDAIAAVDARRQRAQILAHQIQHALAPGADLVQRLGRDAGGRAAAADHQAVEHACRGSTRAPAAGPDRCRSSPSARVGLAPGPSCCTPNCRLGKVVLSGGQRLGDDLVDRRSRGVAAEAAAAAGLAGAGPHGAEGRLVAAAAAARPLHPLGEDHLRPVGRQRLGDRARLEGEVGLAAAAARTRPGTEPLGVNSSISRTGNALRLGLGPPVEERHERRQRRADARGPGTQEIAT